MRRSAVHANKTARAARGSHGYIRPAPAATFRAAADALPCRVRAVRRASREPVRSIRSPPRRSSAPYCRKNRHAPPGGHNGIFSRSEFPSNSRSKRRTPLRPGRQRTAARSHRSAARSRCPYRRISAPAVWPAAGRSNSCRTPYILSKTITCCEFPLSGPDRPVPPSTPIALRQTGQGRFAPTLQYNKNFPDVPFPFSGDMQEEDRLPAPLQKGSQNNSICDCSPCSSSSAAMSNSTLSPAT